MLKNQESRTFVLMGEFAIMLALQCIYNLVCGRIYYGISGLQPFRMSFYLEFLTF